MTSPTVTIDPGAPISQVVSVMRSYRIKRLPVVDLKGKLLGHCEQVRSADGVLAAGRADRRRGAGTAGRYLVADAAGVSVEVPDGVVMLTGQPAAADLDKLVPVAVRLVWDIEVVVDVVEKLGTRVTGGR
jgi:CBS domain-containing protein